jgi:NADH:ubiquinone oxidoreductase subunit 6 (subunit J)
MAPLPFHLLLWPLRKAAIIPSVAVLSGIVFAYVGAADISYTVSKILLPSKHSGTQKTDANGTQAVASSVALSLSAAIVTVRELYFKPAIAAPPTPPAAASQSFTAQMSSATASMKHFLQTYPYKFRFTSVVVAGAVAGSTYRATEVAFNRRGVEKGEQLMRVVEVPATPVVVVAAAPAVEPVVVAEHVDTPAAETDASNAASAEDPAATITQDE